VSVKKQEQQRTPGCPAEHFEGLVPDEVIAAYTKLVATGRLPKEEAADFLGDAQLVDELGKWGMAHVVPHTASSPPSYRAVSPDLALMGVLGVWQAKLAHQHKLVYDGYHRLVAAQAVPAMSTDQVPAHLIRVLTETDEIARVSMDLINSGRREYMTLETADTEMPITNDFPVKGPAELCDRLRIRSIYDVRFAEHPIAREWIGACVRDGEEARVLRHLPMKMKLADESAVLMPLTTTGTTGALLIMAPPITRAAKVLFELLWLQSTPFGSVPGSGPLTDRERQVLQDLATGSSDEVVGSHMGCSGKTVSRQVEAVQRKLGLGNTSRFQLGYTIGSRGWLTGPTRDSAASEARNA
jgi:DNA-binding CsgD family transcriptional regulator